MKRRKHIMIFKEGFLWRVSGSLGAGWGITSYSSWEKAFVYAQYGKVLSHENAVLFLKGVL